MATTIISDKGRKANLLSSTPNCPIGKVTFESYKDKRETTGVWQRVKFANGQVALIETGHLAALHNNGEIKIFVADQVNPGDEAEFLAEVNLGVQDGELFTIAA